MIRYSLFLAIIAGTAATAIASVNPSANSVATVQSSGSSTVYKTSVDTLALNVPAHHVVLEQCAVEDCSDTPQN
jgi:hypothetical protein